MDIENLYLKTKRLYKQKGLYISTKHIEGLHFAVRPDYPRTFFSEYVFGNIHDMKKIVEYARGNIFKSFYCSMCTIEEPDNFSVSDDCGNLEMKENLALQINKHVFYPSSPVKLILCGTTPQYYYNHLLLCTEEHYSTYMIFADLDLFKAVFSFSADLAAQSPSSKLVFNGNFGSDMWHFHVHVTDTAIAYVDKHSFIPYQQETVWEENGVLGCVNYKFLASENMSYLFERAAELTQMIYTPKYMSRECYLSAVFKTIIIGGILYHCIFLITGNLTFPVVNGKTYRIIFPAAALSTANTVFTKKLNDEVVSQIVSKGCYFNWEKLQILKKPANSLRVEFFEKNAKKNCQINYLAHPDVLNIFQVIDDCILKEKGCGTKLADTFATYKYAMSLVFICLAVEIYKTRKENTAAYAYKFLVSNQKFLVHALKSGAAYMKNNYNINSKSLFLKGPLANYIFETSFNNFSLTTSNNIDIPVGSFSSQTSRVTEWVNFDPKKKLGKGSAMGVVFSSSLRGVDDTEFVIKTVQPRHSGDQKVQEQFLSEFACGVKINKLRENIPNFILTLSGFECNSNPVLDTICQGGGSLLKFILLEKVNNSISFRDYISDPSVNSSVIYLSILQIAAGLLWAQNTMDFTHYDLHTENIMVSNVSTSEGNPVLYNYYFNLGKNVFQIPAFVNCSIIDYGSSYVSGLNKYTEPKHSLVENYGMTTTRPNLNRDLYSIIIHTFFIFLYSKTEREIEEFYSKDGDLKNLIKSCLNAYSGIFVNSAFEWIMNFYFSNRPRSKEYKNLLHIFDSSRIDKKYFLYLPKDFPSISSGIYGNLLDFLRSNDTSKYLSYVDPSKEFNWGDYDSPGCKKLVYQILKDEQKKDEMDGIKKYVNTHGK